MRYLSTEVFDDGGPAVILRGPPPRLNDIVRADGGYSVKSENVCRGRCED